MRQSIPFTKDLIFKTNIAEITSISLEKNITVEDDDMLSGDFTVTGKYKMTDASENEEIFNYNIPFDIALDYRYNKDYGNIEVADFEYEIINDDVLRVKILLMVEGLEKREEEVREEERNVMGEEELVDDIHTINNINVIEKEEEIIPVDNDGIESSVEAEPMINPTEKIKSLFDSIDDSDETHITYKVYIVRADDTIDNIIIKYNTNKEELAKYNDIDNIKIGDKIIIPCPKNE
jgi:LysM repeat protein